MGLSERQSIRQEARGRAPFPIGKALCRSCRQVYGRPQSGGVPRGRQAVVRHSSTPPAPHRDHRRPVAESWKREPFMVIIDPVIIDSVSCRSGQISYQGFPWKSIALFNAPVDICLGLLWLAKVPSATTIYHSHPITLCT